MTTDSITSLEDLADKVDDEFTPYKQPTEFKSISLINDTSSPDRPTLIIHVDGEEASSVADRVEKVCADHGAHTQRSATDL